MSQIVYLNGQFLADSEARISIHDRGFLYGDGLFDTMRAYEGIPFRIEDHIERLRNSADCLGITIGAAPGEIKEIINELLARNGLENAYLRITVTRGIHSGDLSFDSAGPSTLLIVARPLTTPSEADYERGVSAALVQGCGNPAPIARHKTISYLPYLIARELAAKSGAREAILVDDDGMILESSTGNVFIVLGEEIVTPPVIAGILPGIARKTVLELAPSIGIKAKEDTVAVKDLASASEAFVTNSIVEILPITHIDGKGLGDNAGEVTRRISRAYKEEVKKYIKGICLKIQNM